LAVGTLGAWYETAVLLGSISPSDLLAGFALEALWFCFVISVVTAFTSVLRGIPAIVGAAIALLLALGLLSSLPALSSWLPTRLAEGAATLVQHNHSGDLWQPVLVAAAASVVLVGLAMNRLSLREP
ncbi:MAG TPA: hypothetical protein VH916_00620, partial [Dehalococcoidia bacterium]